MPVPWIWRQVYVRYIGASAVALAVDMLLFLMILGLGSAPVLASAAGYGAGIVVHWLLSSRAVFARGLAQGPEARAMQKAMFVASALIGLALTTAIVGLGDVMGVDPRLAKLAAIGIAFQTTYWLRQRVVFA